MAKHAFCIYIHIYVCIFLSKSEFLIATPVSSQTSVYSITLLFACAVAFACREHLEREMQ